MPAGPQTTNCPNCGWEVDAAPRCENCGKPLEDAAPAPPATAEAAPRGNAREQVQAALAGRKQAATRASRPADVAEARPSSRPAPPPPPPPPQQIESECEDLRLSYNVKRIFKTGISMPFEFQVAPAAKGIRKLAIYVDSSVLPEPQKVRFRQLRLRVGRSYQTGINFRPPEDCQGVIYFYIYVTYEQDDEQHWFFTQTRHTVYPPDQPADQIAREIHVNVTNAVEANAEKAGRVQVRQSGQAVDEVLRAVRSGRGTQSILDRLMRDAYWQELDLQECGPPSFDTVRPMESVQRSVSAPPPPPAMPPAPAGARLDRLTLRVDDRLVHLLHAERVLLGKNRRDCDIVTRIFLPGGTADKRQCRYISRRHCSLERRGAEILLRDGGPDTDSRTRLSTSPSACGTGLNGVPLAPGAASPLTPDRENSIGIAAVGSATPHLFTLEAVPLRRDDADAAPAALILRRGDDVPESFLVLWDTADLGLLDNRLEGLSVCRDQGAFRLESNGVVAWLTPGDTPSQVTDRIAVIEYSPWGL